MIDRRAGGGLVHPVPLAAIAILVLNDHVLKVWSPGWVSGKLSDFAGMAYFPLLLVAAWELTLSRFGRFRGPSRRALAVACVATALAFTIAKTTPWGADAYRWAFGIAKSLFRGHGTRASFVADPTDLIALPAVLAAWATGSARVRHLTNGDAKARTNDTEPRTSPAP